jgi:hypothetical protein
MQHGKTMGELLKRFYELWLASSKEAAKPVYFRGEDRIATAMQQLGMELVRPGADSRIEFWSPARGSLSGAWLSELPGGGEATQRVFASAFQGLVAGSPMVVLHHEKDPRGLLAWLRQAGFELVSQGAGPQRCLPAGFDFPAMGWIISKSFPDSSSRLECPTRRCDAPA